MSRYHEYHYSPYPSHRPASRWPWVLGLLAVVAFVAVAAVLIRGEIVHMQAIRRSLGGAAPTAAVPNAELAAVPATTTATTGVDSTAAPPPAADRPAGAPADPGPPQAPSEEVAEDAEADAPPTATVAATPTAAPTVVPADSVVQTYVERWSAGDYGGLYDLLSEDAQRAISREDFVARYEAIAERAGLTALTARVDGEANLQREVPIRVDFESNIVGPFTEMNRVPLVRDGDAWKVAWTPSLIFKDLGADGCVDLDLEPARRGSILDRDRQPLAYDGTVQRVGVVPGRIEPGDEARVLRELSELTGMTPEELKERYEGQNPDWFVPIKDFPEEREDELLNVISQLPGVSVQAATARVYPLGPKAAHVTGYVSEVTAEQLEADPSLVPGQIVGQAGVEAGADELLTGQPGARLIVVQCETRAERTTIAERPGVPAKDLVLTIDRELQEAADAALTAQGDVKGSAVVLDPRTGAVLAMVSHPSYDPNGFVLGFSERERQALTSESQRPLLNRAAQAAYPTGSIFKAITFAAAMEHLGYTGETGIDCPSTFSLEGSNQVWEDWTVAEGLGPQGWLTLHQALVNSCNTVFYQLGRDLDRTDDRLLPDMAKAFGLGAPTDIPYLAEVAGTVPDPKWKLDTFGDYWATGDAVNLAIGQGFLEATPLQMATAYAAIANGGSLLRPYIVDKALARGGTGEQLGERVVRRELPLSRATLRELQSALRDQTSDWNGAGSARVFGDFPWPIAGKTGTAQNQLERGKKPHSWFAAFGPYGEEATIVSVVMIESVGEGVSFAAPATRRIYEAYLGSDLAGGG